MTQPPQDPAPDDRSQPRPPQDEPHAGRPGAYGGGEQLPPYRDSYGRVPPSHGGRPGSTGPPGSYPDPAAGLAGRWARLGAAIIDGLLVGAVVGLLILPFVSYDRLVRTPGEETWFLPTGGWISTFISIFVPFLYFWLPTYRWGQTLGKKALGIQVVRADGGGAVTQEQAVARAGFYAVLGGLCGCIGFLDVTWILWDERRQALHDKVAQTVVRKAGPGMPDPYAGR